MSALFRIHGLCFAKVNYFRNNREKYRPYVYDLENGFRETEWWDAEFLKHMDSGLCLDFRQLNGITEIEKFYIFCAHLESLEK